MTIRAIRRLAALAVVLLMACAPAPPVRALSEDPPAPAEASFQARLDELGIPLRLPPGRAILVNVPAFELVAFEDGVPVLRSRIIVGTPRNRTPLMDTYVSRVSFRPSWRPTPSMIASGEYRDHVRPPGRRNPLGLAAVRLEPGLLVYLHDTNQRQLFARDRRALSHGCIRVQHWDALIAWILDRDLDWVRATAEKPPSRDVPAPPIPVLIRYLPVFPAEDGTVIEHPDVYGLGGAVAVAEEQGADAPPPSSCGKAE